MAKSKKELEMELETLKKAISRNSIKKPKTNKGIKLRDNKNEPILKAENLDVEMEEEPEPEDINMKKQNEKVEEQTEVAEPEKQEVFDTCPNCNFDKVPEYAPSCPQCSSKLTWSE